MLVVWGLAGLLDALPQRAAKTLACVSMAAVLLLCACLSRAQIGYWQNTRTLLEHALKINPNNAVAQYQPARLFVRSRTSGHPAEGNGLSRWHHQSARSTVRAGERAPQI